MDHHEALLVHLQGIEAARSGRFGDSDRWYAASAFFASMALFDLGGLMGEW